MTFYVRTKISGVANFVHRKQSESGKMDSYFTLCSFENNANINRVPSINRQLLRLLYDRFGRLCFWIATSHVVTNFCYHFHSPNLRFYPQFLYIFLQINPRFPFDTKNPIGYLIAVFMEYIFDLSILVSAKCLAIYLFGTFFMLFPLVNDIKYCLKTINYNARHKKERPKISNQFFQFVQYHSKLKQLSHILVIYL